MTGVVASYGPRGRFCSRRGWPEPFRLFSVGVSATPTKERPMRSLSLHAGVAAIVLSLSIPLALAQSGGGGAGGAGGAGGGAAGGSAAGAAGDAGATGGAAGTGAASPSATTASPGMAPSSVTGGTTGAGAAPPSSTGGTGGSAIPSGTGPAPERTPGQSSSTPSHNVPTTGAPAGIPRATAPTRPPSGQATLPTSPPAGRNATPPGTSGRGGGARSTTDRPLGGMDVGGTPKIMNDPSLGPIR